MRFRTLLRVVWATTAVLGIALLYNALQVRRFHGAFEAADARRRHAAKLADQLRQSSDDLTRLVRTYVVTEDPAYRGYFERVLAIRNGASPRPPGYDGVYWDYMIPGEREPVEEGEARALADLFRDAGLEPEEVALLEEARRRSDALVAMEDEAMGLVAGASALEPEVRAQRLAEARRLVHGLEYHRAKAGIMAPIDRFSRVVDARLEREARALADAERRAMDRVWLLLFVNLLSLGLTSVVLQRGVLGPIARLAAQSQRIADGDYDARIERPADHELGQLAADFNTMAAAVRRDVLDARARAEELRGLKAKAEAANEAKSHFLANMSHEMRTPMNAVMGYAQLLVEDEAVDAAHRAQLEHILRSGRHLMDLIDDVLDLSKVEAGELVLEQIAFDLARLVEEAGASYRPLLEGKPVELIVDASKIAGLHFFGDPTRVRQILFNLLGNARKFTADGEIGVRAEAEDGQVVLTVWDTGIGISEEAQRRLFQPFTQADESTTRRFGGTGLGLALCRELATAMGGQIELESKEREGSCIRVRLPLPAVAAPAPADPRASETSVGGQALDGEVLVVDDNAVNLAVMQAMLRRFGVEADAARDGEEAILQLSNKRYDLVFMDVQMPVMDGYQAVREWRAREEAGEEARTPVVALTANAMAGDREQALASGMDDYLSKPVRMERLADVLSRYLGAEAR